MAKTMIKSIRRAIKKTMEVEISASWKRWAESWLSGGDRTSGSATNQMHGRIYAKHINEEMRLYRMAAASRAALHCAWAARHLAQNDSDEEIRQSIQKVYVELSKFRQLDAAARKGVAP
jgi:hypothetical protein